MEALIEGYAVKKRQQAAYIHLRGKSLGER